MSIFDKLLKKVISEQSITLYSPGQPSQSAQQDYQIQESNNGSCTKLKDGDLPWGWVTQNKDFISKIEHEYYYFLNCWVENRNKSPREEQSALKSLLQYISDVQNLCERKGECFIFWCNNYLLNIEQLKRLNIQYEQLTQSLDRSQQEYEKHIAHLNELEVDLFNFLLRHPGILQKDVYEHFPIDVKSDISRLLYSWDKSGKIERVKQGNTYILTINK